MAPDSILDLAEARRRLQQITRDHARLVDLMGELREAKDRLNAIADKAKADGEASIEQFRTRTESMLSELREEATRLEEAVEKAGAQYEKLRATANEFRQDARGVLQRMRSSQEAWEKEAVQSLANYENKVDVTLTSLDEGLSQWQENQNSRFEEFRDEHHSELQRMTKAYERMRASYESMKMTAGALESGLDEVESELRTNVQEMGAHLGSLQDDLVARTSELEELLHKQVKGIEEKIARDQTTRWILHVATWVAVAIVLLLVLVS
ncbi:MAG: hypothetical protein R6X33_13390 [Candidatus Brocadiia bacterium]